MEKYPSSGTLYHILPTILSAGVGIGSSSGLLSPRVVTVLLSLSIATILWVKYSSSSFEPTVTTSPTSSSANSAFFEKTRSPRCKVSAMLSLVTAYPFAPERRLKATKPTEITVIIARILNKTLPTFGFTLSFFMQPCR